MIAGRVTHLCVLELLDADHNSFLKVCSVDTRTPCLVSPMTKTEEYPSW